MEYGLQMYSLRDTTKDDLKGALKKVSEMGYKGVEFAGFFDHPAEEVKGWLKEFGLTVTGTHTAEKLVRENFEETVAYHKAIGCDTLIIPWLDLTTADKVDAFIDDLNKWQPMLEKEGISLQFHNHNAEFLPNKDGVIPMDEMIKRTNIKFEIDTYWAYVAKRNPIEVLEQLKGRISFIHLKDGDIDGHGVSLGLGTAPVKEIREYCIKNGIYMVVESEGCEPDGVSEVKRCIDFLKTLD